MTRPVPPSARPRSAPSETGDHTRELLRGATSATLDRQSRVSRSRASCSCGPACGRGRAEDNHMHAGCEHQPSGGDCPPPLTNRASVNLAIAVRDCSPRRTGPTTARNSFLGSKEWLCQRCTGTVPDGGAPRFRDQHDGASGWRVVLCERTSPINALPMGPRGTRSVRPSSNLPGATRFWVGKR